MYRLEAPCDEICSSIETLTRIFLAFDTDPCHPHTCLVQSINQSINQYQSSDVPNTTAHTYVSANIPKKQVTKNLIDSFALICIRLKLAQIYSCCVYFLLNRSSRAARTHDTTYLKYMYSRALPLRCPSRTCSFNALCCPRVVPVCWFHLICVEAVVPGVRLGFARANNGWFCTCKITTALLISAIFVVFNEIALHILCVRCSLCIEVRLSAHEKRTNLVGADIISVRGTPRQ